MGKAMNLVDLLEGRDERSHRALERLRLSMTETENILWYPSAGRDFRSILEMHPIRRTQHGIGVNPSIICHTDHRANQRPQQGIVYDDNRTTVDVLDVFQLRFWPAAYSHPSVPLCVKPTTIIGLHTPIFLLVVRVASTTLGVVKRDVLYFVADNYAFLNQVLVRHSLRLTHMVKVRQGYGFGHINPCLTGSYTTAVHLGLNTSSPITR